jgi:hypothetical protein
MRQLFVIAAVGLITAVNIPSPGTCGYWVPQTNGIKWRMCADQQNRVYCETKRGRNITRIQCP